MSTFITKDGTELFYKDWGDGPVVTFSHGWPLNSDAWDSQMFFLASKGFRCIAHDRRGHGRSSNSWAGNTMDTYADDLAELLNHLDLTSVTMVGHSTGGGEVAHYIGRHGSDRVSKVVLIGAITPFLLNTTTNPGGVPIEVFDGMRAAYLADRAQFFRGLAGGPFFGFNRPGATVSQGLSDAWWLQAMATNYKGAFDCIAALSETDFRKALGNFDFPTLIVHGDDDQIVPIELSAKLTAKLVRTSELKIYSGGSHGIPQINAERLNRDLLEFINS